MLNVTNNSRAPRARQYAAMFLMQKTATKIGVERVL